MQLFFINLYTPWNKTSHHTYTLIWRRLNRNHETNDSEAFNDQQDSPLLRKRNAPTVYPAYPDSRSPRFIKSPDSVRSSNRSHPPVHFLCCDLQNERNLRFHFACAPLAAKKATEKAYADKADEAAVPCCAESSGMRVTKGVKRKKSGDKKKKKEKYVQKGKREGEERRRSRRRGGGNENGGERERWQGCLEMHATSGVGLKIRDVFDASTAWMHEQRRRCTWRIDTLDPYRDPEIANYADGTRSLHDLVPKESTIGCVTLTGGMVTWEITRRCVKPVKGIDGVVTSPRGDRSDRCADRCIWI